MTTFTHDMIESKKISYLPFLYYVKDGICLENSDMPLSAEGFRGWTCASHIIKNQDKHKKEDIESCLKTLRDFVKTLKESAYTKEVLQDTELYEFL